MSTNPQWHPTWWKNEVHGSAWQRVSEAMERDWMQTRHDLGIGGHELNQSIVDTAKQAAGSESIPSSNLANPPRVLGNWDEAEIPYGFGHAARAEFGTEHPQWTPELESRLEREWAGPVHGQIDWSAARGLVRRGYEYDDVSRTWPGPMTGMM